MSELDRYDNGVWDRFFDFVSQPVEEMSRDEVQDELKKRSIDVTRAVAKVQRAVAASRARASLERARSERVGIVQQLKSVIAPAATEMRERLRAIIGSNLHGSTQAAYFRKLESAASESDLRALLDDIERLNTLSEVKYASKTDSE
jgi:hypothetical protein